MVIRVVYNTLHRMVYPFLPEFSRGLGQSFTTLTQVLTARSVLSALTPWVAVDGDVRGRKFAVLLGLGLFTFGAGIVIIWPTFPVFVTSLMLTSIGKFIIDPSLHAYIGDRVPFQKRGLAIGIIEIGWSMSILARASSPLSLACVARERRLGR